MNDAPWQVIRRLEAREDELEKELADARAERARAVEALGDIGRAAEEASGSLEDGINAELLAKNAELEKLRARFRLAPGLGRYVADTTPVPVTLPRNAADFLATLVGGTGADVWGPIALHFELMSDGVRNLYDVLTAAARDTRCVSCGEPLVQRDDGWYHAGKSCGVLIVPEHLQ